MKIIDKDKDYYDFLMGSIRTGPEGCLRQERLRHTAQGQDSRAAEKAGR